MYLPVVIIESVVSHKGLRTTLMRALKLASLLAYLADVLTELLLAGKSSLAFVTVIKAVFVTRRFVLETRYGSSSPSNMM